MGEIVQLDDWRKRKKTDTKADKRAKLNEAIDNFLQKTGVLFTKVENMRQENQDGPDKEVKD